MELPEIMPSRHCQRRPCSHRLARIGSTLLPACSLQNSAECCANIVIVSADIMQSRPQLNSAGLQVTILEGTSEAGKKILISGGKRWYA